MSPATRSTTTCTSTWRNRTLKDAKTGSRHSTSSRDSAPRAVVAGHKRYGKDDNPRTIDETRQYIRDFDRLDKETATAEDLYRQMLAIYPHRVNPDALWLSAQSAKS